MTMVEEVQLILVAATVAMLSWYYLHFHGE